MRLCIIDDDPGLSKALKIYFQSNAYAVDFFTDSVKGQNHLLLNHSNYDLIVLDWAMPEITGLEICKTLRESDVHTPVLMLTAVHNTNNKVEALNAGADDYLTKPFNIPELLARVRALLRRPKEQASVILTVGDISLNTLTHKVIVAGKQIPVTLKEFSILEYLMMHNNQVIGRDMILDHVWDMGFVSFSNIIDVRINGLRKKLGKNAKNTIKTIRGVGYKFEHKKSSAL